MYFVQGLLILATLYLIALVVLIVQRTRAYPAGRNLAWYLLSIACWTACIGLMLPYWGEAAGIWFARAAFFTATFMVFQWMWFCAHFPLLSPRFRNAALGLALLGVPWLVLAWTSLLVERIYFRSHWIDSDMGPLLLPFGVWVTVSSFAAAAHLFRKGKRVHGIARMQIRYLLLGFLGLSVAGIVLIIVIPVLYSTTRYSLYGPLIAAVFIAATITISFIRNRLLDIKVVLREALAYLLSLVLLALLFMAAIPWLERLTTNYLHLPSRSGVFIAAFLLALAFGPAQKLIESLLERRIFLTGLYDFRAYLRAASHALASARDQHEIATMLAESAAAVEPYGVVVFLPGLDEELTRAVEFGSWENVLHRLPPESAILRDYLLQTDEVLLAEELLRQPEPRRKIGEMLTGWGAAAVVPLIAGQRLRGVLLLREKQSGEMYLTDELGFLRILGKQAAIALDNVRHFDEVKVMNEYHTRLLHIMQDGVIALDPRQQVMTFNRAAEEITGVPASAALGKPVSECMLFDTPLDMTGEQPRETVMTRKSGEKIPVLFSVTPFTRSGETDQCRLLVLRDLSAMHELQQAKMQAERFSSMGAMAASLAHEIMNPLVPIQTFAHLLPEKYDDEEFRREFSVTVVHEVERINWLVGQMLDMVRKPSTEREEVSFREVIQRLLDIIQPECEKQHIRVHFVCAPNLPIIMGVMTQLYQATMNVLVNAVQAMPDGGDLTVVLGVIGPNLVCRITDTGSGVPREELPRIFEPLFSRKAGRSGMGLALTYQFIHFHGGEVHADSTPGAGLTVTMVLPVGEQAADTTEAELSRPEFNPTRLMN